MASRDNGQAAQLILRPKTDNSRRKQAPGLQLDTAIFRGRTHIALPSPTHKFRPPIHLGSLVLHHRSTPYSRFSVMFSRSHTSYHTFAGPWCFPPHVSALVRSVLPCFCLYMPPPRLFIRFCTVGGVPLSSPRGRLFLAFQGRTAPLFLRLHT